MSVRVCLCVCNAALEQPCSRPRSTPLLPSFALQIFHQSWKALDELEAGLCDELTYKEVQVMLLITERERVCVCVCVCAQRMCSESSPTQTLCQHPFFVCALVGSLKENFPDVYRQRVKDKYWTRYPRCVFACVCVCVCVFACVCV